MHMIACDMHACIHAMSCMYRQYVYTLVYSREYKIIIDILNWLISFLSIMASSMDHACSSSIIMIYDIMAACVSQLCIIIYYHSVS